MSGGTVWAPNLWATDFWADVFWFGDADTEEIDLPVFIDVQAELALVVAVDTLETVSVSVNVDRITVRAEDGTILVPATDVRVDG